MTLSNSPSQKIWVGENSVRVFFTGTKLHHFEISIGWNAKFYIFAWLL